MQSMTDKKPKRPRDANQLAKFIVDLAGGESAPIILKDGDAKKRVGEKGGKARAKSLNPEQRSEISSIAVSARWKKKN
jgi:hypothetical protein